MSNRLTDENRRAKAGKRFKEKEKKTRAEQIIEQVNEHLDEVKIEIDDTDDETLSKKDLKILKKKQKREAKLAKKLEKKEKAKKSVVRKIFKFLLFVLLIYILFFIYRLGKNDWNFGRTFNEQVLGPKDPVTILVMGVSEDLGGAPLTDTMMVIGYNPNEQKAYALSVPRDTFIGSSAETASGSDKLNSLYKKSPEKTIAAIEKITGLEIDYYCVVQNKVVRDVVDALGAVEFNVPIDMNYDDPTQKLHIHLKKGIQSMNGEQVEQLLRFRHNNDGSSYPASYGDNDIGRMRTQREFVKELLKQCIRFQNVGKIVDLATAFFNNVDTNMSLSTAVSYIPYALQFNPDDLLSEQVPGEPVYYNEVSFIRAFPKETLKLVGNLIEQIGLEEEAEEFRIEHKLITKKTTTNTTNTTNTSNTTNTIKNTVSNKTTNTSNTAKKNTTSNTSNTSNKVSNKLVNATN